MNDCDLISVIIPVYGVERYLEACVESIRKQTYPKLEIILVDDGSKDRSGAICDELAARDARIHVIHQQNAGLSGARNSGMRIASGDYMAFIDSDDIADPEMMECLHRACVDTGADIACGGYGFIEENGKPAEDAKLSFEERVYTPDEFQDTVFHAVPTNSVVWNKLYRTALIKDLSFRIGKINEDEFFTYRAVDRAKKVVSVCKTVYYNRKNPDSITHRAYSVRNLDKCEAMIEKAGYFHKEGKTNFAGMALLQFCTSMSMIRERGPENDNAFESRYKELKRNFFKQYGSMGGSMSGKVRLSVQAFKIHRKLYMAIRSMANRR